MKIKNYQLETLLSIFKDILDNSTLKGKYSRSALKLFNALFTYYESEYIPFKQMLYEEHAIRDEDGNIIYKDKEKNKWDVNVDELLPHLEEYMNESYEFELNSLNKNLLLLNCEILLEGDFEVTPQMAEIYDELCMEAERVIEYYETSEVE